MLYFKSLITIILSHFNHIFTVYFTMFYCCKAHLNTSVHSDYINVNKFKFKERPYWLPLPLGQCYNLNDFGHFAQDCPKKSPHWEHPIIIVDLTPTHIMTTA